MRIVSWVLAGMITFSTAADACTDFLIQTKDNTVLNSRSMEFAINLQTELTTYPRGESVQSPAPNGKEGLSWTSKYGYVAFTVFNLDFAVDGMNEKGLSMGGLWLPGTQYETISPENSSSALLINDIGSWLLGNFATVAEVRDALGSIHVWGMPMQQLGNGIPTIHLSVHDAKGESLVIEFINGEMQVHENPVAVLTNAPNFEWHLTNLRNYINLRALNAGEAKMGSIVLDQIGQGTGLQGIPGDWTPPSRFVRIANFKQFATQPQNAAGGVVLATHLLNTVDIPYGDVVEQGKKKSMDFTQWTTIKDLTNKVLYYRTYQDTSLKKIDFSQLDFTNGMPTSSQPLSTTADYPDVSGLFRQSEL